GRAFLCPSLPLVWDLNWMLIEREGMTVAEVIAAAEVALTDFQHRTVAIRGEADGARLAKEIEDVPGWEAETTIYMVWRGESGRRAQSEVREARLTECEDLRRELIRSGLSAEATEPERTTEQLLEMDHRFSAVAAGRWFLAPAQDPASACCLFSADGIGQVEEVGTLPAARGRGLAQAAILAAIAASQDAGHRVTFLGADANDWPRLMYEKLGFETCGTMHVLRRILHQG
ncbi:MAG: GNAT family N-acetyltransferase, partial [Actinomycetota bacterium]|nr:GNAT family N-acetyltransferase [Actinomycetota bacterium]